MTKVVTFLSTKELKKHYSVLFNRFDNAYNPVKNNLTHFLNIFLNIKLAIFNLYLSS